MALKSVLVGCSLLLAGWAVAVQATTLSIDASSRSVGPGESVWLVGKKNGRGASMTYAVNGVQGGNSRLGTIDSRTGRYLAPAFIDQPVDVVVTGHLPGHRGRVAAITLTLQAGEAAPGLELKRHEPGPRQRRVRAADEQTIAAARFLEQASFGPTAAELALVKQIGPDEWISRQLSMPATSIPGGTSNLGPVMNSWFTRMVSAPDQLRQRVIFALSQLFVVSSDKNPYGDQIVPWLQTLSTHSFGNFRDLLRDMSLNPAMGKYLDLGNSVTPRPNENYAREMMQLFTIGLVQLNLDGTPVLDGLGKPVPTFDSDRIIDFSRALSGWTYAGSNQSGLNWESFNAPLQPRDNYHDKTSKQLLQGTVLPPGQSTTQDFEAVIDNLMAHPNLGPFVAQRLIRQLVTSNPSGAYVARVASVFNASPSGRGNLAATVRAVLMDAEARQDIPTQNQGHLKDTVVHTVGLIRSLGGRVVNATNLMWDYYLAGQRLTSAPSVFNFYSPLARMPGAPNLFGPEFQIYGASMAVRRSNLIYRLISGEYASMVAIDINPFVRVAGDANALVNQVDQTLLHGRMSPATRSSLTAAVAGTTDARQRALTALYLTALADFAVHQ